MENFRKKPKMENMIKTIYSPFPTLPRILKIVFFVNSGMNQSFVILYIFVILIKTTAKKKHFS